MMHGQNNIKCGANQFIVVVLSHNLQTSTYSPQLLFIKVKGTGMIKPKIYYAGFCDARPG